MTQIPQPPIETPQGPPAKQGNGLAIAGMILGIVGLVGLCIWWIGLPCAVVGLVLSIMGKNKAKATGTGGGMATAGIVCSVIALSLGAIGVILVIVGVSVFGSKLQEMQMESEYMQQSLMILRFLIA